MVNQKNQENHENPEIQEHQENQNRKENSLGSSKNPYDLIVSGAGLAGLTAGIIGGRHKLNVLVCEKTERAGSFPRGETLHNARIFSEVLGDNVLNLIATHLSAARKFNSPNAEHSLEIYRRSPSIVYEWDNFINLLLSRIKETSSLIRYNAEVVSPIIENNICKGIRLKSGELIFGSSVMVAEGHTSKLGRGLNFPYDSINCPVVKRLIGNFHGDYMGLEYFFLVPGSLDYAPRFPPGIIFVFPRGNGNCEVGLMIFTDMAQQSTSICDMPSEDELLRVWNNLIATYPRFSDLMQNTKKTFEGITHIASAKVIDDPMPVSGLFFTGGAMGFVEHSGSSGIASSMQIAKFAVDYIASRNITEWNKSMTHKYVRAVRKTKFYRHILANARKTATGKKFLFLRLRTAENINKNWNIVRAAYKLQ
ncbi:MAG: hypothetical protein ACTSYU_05360 [Promethearchaeota archaeon]